MNRFVSNRKCLVFCHFSFVLGALAILGATGIKVSEGSQAAAKYARRLAATKDRLALEAYEKRNAEIAPWPNDSAHANTDNAALLYYQACLLVPEPNEALRYKIRPNAGPTPQIKTYLGKCLTVIEMVETASRIPQCNWAVWPALQSSQLTWISKLGLVTDILLLDATTLAVDGHYRVALERCLTVRRIVRHLSDDPELYRYEGLDTQALYTIRILLGMMPPDADTLTWLRDQFAAVPGPRLSFAMTLEKRARVQLEAMRTYQDHLRSLRKMALEQAKDQQAERNLQNLTDKQFRARFIEGITHFNDSILEIIEGEATYEEKLSQVHELCEEIMNDDAADPIVKAFISPSGMNTENIVILAYSREYVQHRARVNVIKAAVEVYLILAQTGKLPEKLPEHLPKDPFTCQDFVYKITDEGFSLRWQGGEFLTQREYVLEFRVRR